MSNFCIVTGINSVRIESYFISRKCIANSYLAIVVYNIILWFTAFVHKMIFPKRIYKKRFHDILLINSYRIDGVHKVRILHHQFGRLFRKVHSWRVNHIQQARIGKIFYIIHYRGTAGINKMCQLTDVWSLRSIYSEKVEKFLNFCQIFQFNLLNEENVYLSHHIHGFQ